MKYNYLENLNASRNSSKFNMVYESIMKNLEIYKNIEPAKNINDASLSLILEEIDKPQYIVCESSGRKILLEEAIFMNEDDLIYEGILEKVGQKIQQIIDWIKKGIKEVLSKSSDMIKAFCEKVKNNKVVAAIRKKLGLDEKLKSERFKNFVKVKANGKEVSAESILNSIENKHIISEATKLNKKEEAITDPKELEPLIKKWEDALSGKKVINNAKTGQPLSKKYCQDKLRLLKNKMASLQDGGESSNSNEASSDQNAKNESKNKSSNNKKKSLGDIHFDVEGINNTIGSIKDESISEEAVNSAAKNSAVAIGGDDASKIISGDSKAPEGDEEAEEPKKKGFLGKLSDKANKVGNKLKDKIKSGVAGAKKWFNSQNKFVKILICCIIAVLAILAIYFLITAVIYPILYSILNGGVVNAIAGVFRIYASGKTFVATYKQGKKSWETGEGWGKTFLLIGASIFAIVNLGQMAAQGSEMMAADQADNAASAAGEGAKNAAAGAEGLDLKNGEIIKTPNGNVEITSMNADGSISYKVKLPDGSTGISKLSSNEVAKLMSSGNKGEFFAKVASQHAPTSFFEGAAGQLL